MVYPLIDVFIYSAEEGFNFASQSYFGVGLYNFSYVLHDPYFLQAVQNTIILVIITVPVSTGLALLISLGLSSIKTFAGSVPDHLLFALRDQHAGSGPCVYDTVSANRVYRWPCKTWS